MFGYVNTDKSLPKEKRGLWQAFMCSLCFSTKEIFGNFPRMLITNDVNFFNVLFHGILQIDVQTEKTRCVSSPVVKRTVIKRDELSDKLSAANVILSYWNVYDDVVDGGSAKKKIALALMQKAYQKAQKQWSELDEQVKEQYERLRRTEQSQCKVIDEVCHSFATLSQIFCRLTLGEQSSEYAETLCYNVGKWIYLIDALDDLEKDVKQKNYNPFAACMDISCAADAQKHEAEIRFLMYAVLNRIAQSYNDLNLVKYTCLTDNVLLHSIRQRTEQVMSKITQTEKKNGL